MREVADCIFVCILNCIFVCIEPHAHRNTDALRGLVIFPERKPNEIIL